MTFLEMTEATESGDTKHFAEPGEGCNRDKEFGKCLECKHWIFSSKAEKKRHISFLHPKYVIKTLEAGKGLQQHKCTFKGCSCDHVHKAVPCVISEDDEEVAITWICSAQNIRDAQNGFIATAREIEKEMVQVMRESFM